MIKPTRTFKIVPSDVYVTHGCPNMLHIAVRKSGVILTHYDQRKKLSFNA
jgi:hypothetical protein